METIPLSSHIFKLIPFIASIKPVAKLWKQALFFFVSSIRDLLSGEYLVKSFNQYVHIALMMLFGNYFI